MNDLIDEVATDIKTENFYLAVKNLTKIFIVIAAIILAITGGWVYYNNKHEEKQLAFNVDYYNLLNTDINDKDFQNKLSTITHNDSEAFGPMANLFYAKKLIANKKFPEAYKILNDICANKNNDITFTNIAKILLLSTATEQNNKEIALPQVAVTDKQAQPFENLLKLTYAEQLINTQNKAEAKAVLESLVANNDSDNIYYLAMVLINNLGNI